MDTTEITKVRDRVGLEAWDALRAWAGSSCTFDGQLAELALSAMTERSMTLETKQAPTGLLASACPGCAAGPGTPCVEAPSEFAWSAPEIVRQLFAPVFKYHAIRALAAAQAVGESLDQQRLTIREGRIHDRAEALRYVDDQLVLAPKSVLRSPEIDRLAAKELESGIKIVTSVTPTIDRPIAEDQARQLDLLPILGSLHTYTSEEVAVARFQPALPYRMASMFVQPYGLPKGGTLGQSNFEHWNPEDLWIFDISVAGRAQIGRGQIPVALFWPCILDSPRFLIDDIDRGMALEITFARRAGCTLNPIGIAGGIRGMHIEARVETPVTEAMLKQVRNPARC